MAARTARGRDLVVVQAVVLREGRPRRVLLSLRSDLFGWELPGGAPEPGESDPAALVREVREETGLEVEVLRHVGDWHRVGFRPHLARVYRCRVVGGVPTPSSETPRLAWFDAERPPAQLLPWYHDPLQSALAHDRSDPLSRRERHGAVMILRALRIDLGMRWRGLPAVTVESADAGDELDPRRVGTRRDTQHDD